MARWMGLLCAAALALALVGTRVAAQASSVNETIIEYLAADERFTVLLELLNETGLLQKLNSTDAKFTFFAPTNDAIFASLNSNTTHAYNLTEILKYHIVPGEFSRVNFTNVSPPGNGLVVVPPVVVPSHRPTSSPTPTPSSSTCICTCPAPTKAPQARRSTTTDSSGSAASGSSSGSEADYVEDATANPTNLTSFALKTLLTLDSLDGQAQRIKALGTSELSVELANNVTVTEPDIQVRNGYIQIINGVLEPPGNVTVVVEHLARNFSLWVELIERINATNIFTEANSTVLLPIELSFPATSKNCSSVACSDAELKEEKDEMDDNMDRVQTLIGKYNDSEWRDILELMVIPNAVLYTDDLATMLNATSSNTTTTMTTNNNSTNATEPSLDFTTAADVSLNISIAKGGDAYNLTTSDGQSAAIVLDARLFDVPTGTGVVHVISRILFPADLAPQKPSPSSLQALLIANNATLFATALNSTHVAAQISGGNYTLFAPTDAAFVSFNNSAGATLTEIVDVHVVPGEPAIVNGAELKPLDANATLLINHDQFAFTVRVLEVPHSFANILSNDTTAAYQVFFIDHVLEPPK